MRNAIKCWYPYSCNTFISRRDQEHQSWTGEEEEKKPKKLLIKRVCHNLNHTIEAKGIQQKLVNLKKTGCYRLKMFHKTILIGVAFSLFKV